MPGPILDAMKKHAIYICKSIFHIKTDKNSLQIHKINFKLCKGTGDGGREG